MRAPIAEICLEKERPDLAESMDGERAAVVLSMVEYSWVGCAEMDGGGKEEERRAECSCMWVRL